MSEKKKKAWYAHSFRTSAHHLNRHSHAMPIPTPCLAHQTPSRQTVRILIANSRPRTTMMRARLSALLWACSAGLSRFADAASTEVGNFGAVTAVAELFDPSLSDENGCDPSGYVAEFSRVSEVWRLLSTDE